MINSTKNNPEFSNLISTVTSGSSGVFTVNDVQIEVNHSQSIKLGQLIGISSGTDEGNGEYTLVIGNREWMNRNGLTVCEDVDRKMRQEEEQGRSAVLCAINSKFLFWMFNNCF